MDSKQYRLRYTKQFQKQLSKLDKSTATIIVKWIDLHINGTESPRMPEKALKGRIEGTWRYRVGQYRVIVKFVDEELLILALQVAHRKEVYR
ncbi:type II toxin-antitoxin system RelE family toxin [Culicoidibacter larvae]|uniref:Type II toxin-antitoxin system RelE/ParE family toxin n=1 Tax=Culicoidibacter larvae TaxID=2579976 RepID=A0A5R8Q7R4_9FIRM|nr:type II toxin-antitoxin system RelE/ParE family toxin [Culicoidibacter larvae]TLG71087.1 type II toxin-antitoxin system RelE/ParE family toxin [Culicoidibacter larvae]